MNRRQLLWLLAIAGVAFWLWKSGSVSRGGPEAAPVPKAWQGAAPGLAGEACLSAAEEAVRMAREATQLLLRQPVDAAAFSAASDQAGSAVSAAESRCGGGGSASEQKAMEEARGALSETRTLLSDFAGALSGSGSASDAPTRIERIDARLAAARAALRG